MFAESGVAGAEPSAMPMDKALLEAVRRFGGMRAMARELGMSHQAISKWDRTPPARVLEIERLTGVSRYRLRPDIFGPAPKSR